MRGSRPLRAALGALGLLALARPAAAQDAPISRALELEGNGKYREAIPLFRQALVEDLPAGLLGLERAYAALGRSDSLVATLDSLVAARPTDALVRSVQIRTLLMSGTDARARTAFDAWARSAPRDPQPYRDYARLLLDAGRVAAADTVLQRAQQALGGGREVAYELATLRAQSGLWEPAARSYREAFASADYLWQAAVHALAPTPEPQRDAVRAALAGAPVELPARRALAWLELGWGAAAKGWTALSVLPPRDSTLEAWLAYAGEAEAQLEWPVALDALVAAQRARPSAAVVERAAVVALQAGQPELALSLLGGASAAQRDSAARALAPLQVRALSRLGRAAEAQRLARDAAKADPTLTAALQRELAWAWVRAGELERARTALVEGGVGPDDELHGWLALYRGDLREARSQLRGLGEQPGADAVAALALLHRTRADSAPAAGAAFLALARGDSARAAALFDSAATTMPDAAPLLLAAAARLHAARPESHDRAIGIWERLVRDHARSPEAAEGELAWARLLRRRGDREGAAARLEHLILTQPESALLPQARRELDLLRGATPPRTP